MTAAPPAKKAKPPKGLGRVLVVEDDAVLAMLLEDALLRAGAGEVEICSSMQATLVALDKRARPDALILDVTLTDRGDGWALAELVTLLGPPSPKIVFATGAVAQIPEHIAALGPVFEKPYDPDEIVRELSKVRQRGLFSRLMSSSD